MNDHIQPSKPMRIISYYSIFSVSCQYSMKFALLFFSVKSDNNRVASCRLLFPSQKTRLVSISTGKTIAARIPIWRLLPHAPDTSPASVGPPEQPNISCQCQHGKHGGSAAFDRCRGFAECTRPEDSHGKTADCTAQQTDHRYRHQNDAQICRDAQQTAPLHEAIQIQAVAPFSVNQTGNAHEHGKRHRAGEVAYGFGNPKSLLRKGRCPLAHRLLRCTGTEHHQEKLPRKAFSGTAAPRSGRLFPPHAESRSVPLRKGECLRSGSAPTESSGSSSYQCRTGQRTLWKSSTTPICPQQ